MRFLLVLFSLIFLCGCGSTSQPEVVRDPGEAKVEAQPQASPADNPLIVMDEIVLPEGSVRLGSADLKFREGAQGVVFLGDGKRFAMLNHNRIRIFDTSKLQQVRGWKADEHVNMAIAATSDGKHIASGGAMIRLWDADSGKMIRQFNKHVGTRIFSLTFSPNDKYLVSLGLEQDQTKRGELLNRPTHGLRVWNAETGTELPAFMGGIPAGMRGAEFTLDNKNLVWCDERDWREGFGKVHMRPLDGGPELTWDIKDKTKWVIPFTYPDPGLEPEKSGPLNWHFNIWDGNKERELRRYKLDQKNIVPRANFHRICFSHDRRYVASAGEYEGIALWGPATGDHRTLLPGKGLFGLDFTRDGKTLVACSGQDIRLFDVATGNELGAVGHRTSVLAVSISPDQKYVATAGADGTIRLWDRATGAELRVLSGDDGGYNVIFLSDQTLAYPGKEGTLRISSLDADKESLSFLVDKGGVASMAVSRARKLLATGGRSGTIRIWNIDTWNQEHIIEGPKGPITALAFGPDGKSLNATCQADKSFRMWDVASGSEVRRFDDNKVLEMVALTVSPDGKLALSNTSSRDKGIMTVWETATGKAHAGLPPIDGFSRAMAFSPDGKTLVVSRYGYMIKENLWVIDTETWQIKGHLPGHPGAINALVFSEDGRYLVSASDDSSAVVWDMTKAVRPR